MTTSHGTRPVVPCARAPETASPADAATAGIALRPGPSAPTLDAALGFRLGRTHRAVRSAWESRIADLDLSGPQASAMRAVAERPGIGLRELARALCTDPMNAKRLADELQRRRLVASVDDPADLRRRALVPTEAGVAVGRELQLRSAAWQRTLEQLLGADDAARLRAILERLEDEVRALPEATDPAATGARGG